MASDPKAKNSIYDFLYYDTRRLAAYLSQLDPDGHLQSLSKTGSVTENAGSKTTTSGGGGVPGLANIAVGNEEQIGEGRSDTSVRTFDPLWANALAFLDYLEQQDLIAPELAKAGIGQFVLVHGTLSVIDMKMLKAAWDAPMIKKKIIEGEDIDKKGKTPLQVKQERSMQTENNSFAFDLLRIMPHSVQGQMFSGDLTWMTLDEAALTVPAGDIALKHGVTLAGEWHALGVLDATPDAGASTLASDTLALSGNNLLHAAVALSSTPIGTIAMALAPFGRMFMGRPATAFGMTPLLIFREVSGPS